MKRGLISLFCMAICLLFLTGCGSFEDGHSSEGDDLEPTRYEIVNNLDGVTMEVKEGTVSSTSLTVMFKNNSKKQCIYGENFLLEKEINGGWYQVPVVKGANYGFNDIGYELASSEVKEWTVDWEWLYGNLDTGNYRIVKELLDDRNPGDYDEYNLTAEFTVY